MVECCYREWRRVSVCDNIDLLTVSVRWSLSLLVEICVRERER